MKYELNVLYMQEIGSRSNQEDSIYPVPANITNNARCFVLCDGMGGHDSGEVASDAVCHALGEYIESRYHENSLLTDDDFCTALQATYDYLDKCDTYGKKKMGTTMVFLALHDGGAFVAHIGDSRLYHLRPGSGILFETQDHSLLNDLLKIGELTEETAKNFDKKHIITRVMQPNSGRRFNADIQEISDVKPGDIFFLCSDGVNESLASKHIAEILLDSSLNDEKKMERIKHFTKNNRDNHTALFVHVCDVQSSSPAPGKKTPAHSLGGRFLYLLLLLLAIIAVVINIVLL